MKIEHIALYVKDLEQSKQFYCDFFGGKSNDKYVNSQKQFSSYFIEFESGCRLELMHQPGHDQQNDIQNKGLHHFAFSVGSRDEVDKLTNILRNKGYEVFGEPRTTGDGYYESIVLDPDRNLVEITE